MPRDIKIDPPIIVLLDQLRALVGPGYTNYGWNVSEDADGVNYTNTASDPVGNSVSVFERHVKPKTAKDFLDASPSASPGFSPASPSTSPRGNSPITPGNQGNQGNQSPP